MVGNFFKKVKESLSKTRNELIGTLGKILPFGSKITDDVLEEIEEVLFRADLGVHTTELIVDELRERAGEINRGKIDSWSVMKEIILGVLTRDGVSTGMTVTENKPHIIFVVGVNGAGKTTTIGKLATRFKNEGHSVLLAACDTFRAAAVEQLDIWADRSGSEIIKASTGADAASVAYDAVLRAQARSTDVVLIDTAGRLHTSKNLMEELKKIRRVINKACEGAPHETLLVLDATTGNNALNQAEVFHKELSVTGIALTKLDGTAKGGIVVSIVDKLGIPVKLIGIGEGLDDLRDFEPSDYTNALFSVVETNTDQS